MDKAVKIDMHCRVCKENVDKPKQYFMLPNIVWVNFCLNIGIDIRDLVCADCYEMKTGKELEAHDLTFVPVNFVFLQERYPKKLESVLNVLGMFTK